MSGYLSYRLAAFLSRNLPGRFAYWVGLRFADLFYLRQRAERTAIMRNLERIFAFRDTVPAEMTLRGTARKTYQNFGKYLVDFFRFSELSLAELRRLVSLEHRSYLEEAVALGRGVIILSAHIGNWELGGAVVAALGHRVNVVVMPERMQRLERLLRSQRESRGVTVLPVGSSAFGILKCLKRGEIVAILGDRDLTGRAAPMDFFGKPAHIPAGPALLSVRSGAPVLPAFLLRQEDDTFLFRIHPPLFPEREKTPENLQRKICAVMEQEIGERPHQWFVFEEFWRDA
jgi:lauroyl/myristoyl acyltransferase